jgi:hypothetical protein
VAPFIPPQLAAILAANSTSQMAASTMSRPLYLGSSQFAPGFLPPPPPPPSYVSAPLIPFSAVPPSPPSVSSLGSFSAAPEIAAPPTINTAAASAATAESPVVDGPGTCPYQLTHLIMVRLTQDNYLYWRAQILPLLRSRHLEGFVDGSHPCPPRLVSVVTATGARVSAENPAYRAWVAQDQAILSALQSSLTEGIAGLVVFAATSLDVWATMADSFSAHSSARASSLRQQLQDCKKLDSSAHVYFNKIKTLADTLSAIGQPLRDSEFTNFVLWGLDQDYDNLVEAVRGREMPTSQRDLY